MRNNGQQGQISASFGVASPVAFHDAILVSTNLTKQHFAVGIQESRAAC